MPLSTPRQRALAAGTLLLVLAAVVTALSGHDGWSIALSAVVLGATAVAVLDLRHRQRALSRRQRRLEQALAERDASHTTQLQTLGRAVQETTAALAELREEVHAEAEAAAARHGETAWRLTRLDHEPVTEVQALLQLLRRVPDAPPLPDLGGWALSASTILAVWDVVQRDRPAQIVECGSGSSSVWLGYAARAAGAGRVVSLEHQADYARQTRAMLARHGLQDVVEVRHAPLTEVEVGGQTFRWYDPVRVEDLHAVDMLLVDGPPKSTGPLARYPAVPLLGDRLVAGAGIVVDDAGRPDERAVVERWVKDGRVEHERHLSRDAVLLRIPRPGGGV
ncbi:Methyltransferase domain-containing protein [Georgenia satyanarayanai]|uniref:Methyltransferase domain-containing protein n=1 Tax=Georgenia satyanarayanai TaxID=860221 RepID=A0A2Y9AGX2_9MICO|nr:class I SAM-dependent methyltransferase [Georgenia satyanarayanai]PYF99404.1 methyltransferase family protein [Georgenia satyanarayanai]SSA43216.1 Methyltransferase domain-containing protein [Georgenia satyanarayanai]